MKLFLKDKQKLMCKETDDPESSEKKGKKKKTYKSNSIINDNDGNIQNQNSSNSDENSANANGPNSPKKRSTSQAKNQQDYSYYEEEESYTDSAQQLDVDQKYSAPLSPRSVQRHPPPAKGQSSQKSIQSNTNSKNKIRNKKSAEESSSISYTPIVGDYSGSYSPLRSYSDYSYTTD